MLLTSQPSKDMPASCSSSMKKSKRAFLLLAIVFEEAFLFFAIRSLLLVSLRYTKYDVNHNAVGVKTKINSQLN